MPVTAISRSPTSPLLGTNFRRPLAAAADRRPLKLSARKFALTRPRGRVDPSGSFGALAFSEHSFSCACSRIFRQPPLDSAEYRGANCGRNPYAHEAVSDALGSEFPECSDAFNSGVAVRK